MGRAEQGSGVLVEEALTRERVYVRLVPWSITRAGGLSLAKIWMDSMGRSGSRLVSVGSHRLQ